TCADRGPGGPARLMRAVGVGVAVVVLLPGCSGVRKYVDKINTEGASYYGLQTFIRDQLTTKFHRSVRSVSCLPHVDQVLPGDDAHLRCLVRFTNGTSYTSRPRSPTRPPTRTPRSTTSASRTRRATTSPRRRCRARRSRCRPPARGPCWRPATWAPWPGA